MSQMNPEKFLNNTTFSVQLLYITGHYDYYENLIIN